VWRPSRTSPLQVGPNCQWRRRSRSAIRPGIGGVSSTPSAAGRPLPPVVPLGVRSAEARCTPGGPRVRPARVILERKKKKKKKKQLALPLTCRDWLRDSSLCLPSRYYGGSGLSPRPSFRPAGVPPEAPRHSAPCGQVPVIVACRAALLHMAPSLRRARPCTRACRLSCRSSGPRKHCAAHGPVTVRTCRTGSSHLEAFGPCAGPAARPVIALHELRAGGWRARRGRTEAARASSWPRPPISAVALADAGQSEPAAGKPHRLMGSRPSGASSRPGDRPPPAVPAPPGGLRPLLFPRAVVALWPDDRPSRQARESTRPCLRRPKAPSRAVFFFSPARDRRRRSPRAPCPCAEPPACRCSKGPPPPPRGRRLRAVSAWRAGLRESRENRGPGANAAAPNLPEVDRAAGAPETITRAARVLRAHTANRRPARSESVNAPPQRRRRGPPPRPAGGS